MSKDEKKRNLILHDKNIYKGLLILAIPLMLNNFIKTIHDVIDMYFVSEIPGFSTEAISSISLTFPVVFTFISLGIGLSAAGTALISQQMGSGQYDKARKYASNLVVIALITGLVLNAVSYFGAPMIMKWMITDSDPYIYANSVKYLQIRAFELPIVFLFFAFTAIRQSSGDTFTPVIYGVITIIVNIILTPLLVSYYNLGVPGAAYATLIANVIIMPVGLMQLFKAKTGITIDMKYLRLDSFISSKLIRTAIPASFGQAFTAIGFGIMNGILFTYGKETVAAFSVGNRLSSIILHPVMAIGGVLAAYIGQNIGNQNIPRAKETFRKAMILSVSIMIVGSASVMAFRGYFAGFFIKDDPVALALTVEYMFYLLLGLPLMAVFQTFLGTFNGTGNTKFTFIITTTRLWILRIPIVLSLKYFTTLGSSGIWYGMLASNVIICIVGIYLYRKIDFKPKIMIDKEKKKSLKVAV